MPCYQGLEGLHQPERLLSEEAGESVLIRVPVDPNPWEPLVRVQWAVLTGKNSGQEHTGLALSTSAQEALCAATREQSRYILCSVLHGGDIVAALGDDGRAPESLVSIAEEAVSVLGC